MGAGGREGQTPEGTLTAGTPHRGDWEGATSGKELETHRPIGLTEQLGAAGNSGRARRAPPRRPGVHKTRSDHSGSAWYPYLREYRWKKSRVNFNCMGPDTESLSYARSGHGSAEWDHIHRSPWQRREEFLQLQQCMQCIALPKVVPKYKFRTISTGIFPLIRSRAR